MPDGAKRLRKPIDGNRQGRHVAIKSGSFTIFEPVFTDLHIHPVPGECLDASHLL